MAVERVFDHLRAIATGAKYLFLKPRLTLMYPEEVEDLPKGYRGMITYNHETCISCGLCAMVCPADAIKMYLPKEVPEGEKRPKRYPGINYTRCIFCGFCVSICPTFSLQHSNIHDVAYYTFEEQIYRPEEFAQGPPKPQYDKEPVKVKVIPDEERGLRYERS